MSEVAAGPFADEPEDLTPDEIEDAQEAPAVAYPISYSGQDFDVEGLVRRVNNLTIRIPTFGEQNDDDVVTANFQRKTVWTRKQKDRFVESLLLGYPVPGIFLVRQPDGFYLVLDGQQRLRTLQSFYGTEETPSKYKLNDVADDFKRKSYRTLTDEERRHLDNSYLHATVVQTDGSNASLEAIYQLFERLNSGGTQLTAHEVRVALYAGPFVDFLEHLNNLPAWRSIYGAPSARLRDQELVLRILALFINGENYVKPLKTFLNAFVAEHRMETPDDFVLPSLQFEQAAQLLQSGGGRSSLRFQSEQVNVAFAEAIMVAVMEAIDAGDELEPDTLAGRIEAAKSDEQLIDAITTRTSDEDVVATRLRRAREFVR